MKVKGKVSVLVFFFLALSAGLAFPEISMDNAGEYLEYGEALAAYDRAEGLSEGHLLYCVYTNRGVLFLITGQTHRGLAELRRSLTIDPKGEKAAAALALYE